MFDVCIALWAPGKRISCTQIKLAWSQWLICCSLRWCFLQLALYSYLAWWTPWAVLCIYDYINIYICIYISIRFTTDVIYYSHVLPQWQLFQCDFVLRGILAGDFIDFASGFIRWTALSGSGTVKAAAWEGLRFWGFPARHDPMLAMFKGENHCFWVITSIWETTLGMNQTIFEIWYLSMYYGWEEGEHSFTAHVNYQMKSGAVGFDT